GAAANDLLMQFQADIIGARVVRPKVIETTAAGAAYVAGLSTGFWQDATDIERIWETERVFEPQMPAEEVSRRRVRWAKALERSKQWAELDSSSD
ncbi:MAG: FGGY-family carbohydrate kinase, partial [Rhodopirellula sp. JB055]|uniref:FGGY-family carbohydrate kinase n=1 Tax=Rhodopirellula sp. JB055 TaxID=3342846 RepID=UPI00370A9585